MERTCAFVRVMHSTLQYFHQKALTVKQIHFLLKMTFLLFREIFLPPKKANYAIQKIKDINHATYLKEVLPPDTYEAFLHGSNFDKAAFCLGEKQGMLVNDESSFGYSRVGDF